MDTFISDVIRDSAPSSASRLDLVNASRRGQGLALASAAVAAASTTAPATIRSGATGTGVATATALAVQRAGAKRNLDIDGQLGNAKATYDRGGQSRQALFDAWDTRIAYAATRWAAS